ncbi:hypothetical protein [Streptomyces sp. NPDC058545]|uniref:hypothetical protein n=1 Tax=Streptomyces sp. NPDC058545 TaxID=3346544 RepID=UPI003650FB9B
MRTHTALAVAAITLLVLTGCGSDTKADPAACKAAMTKAFDEAIAAGNEAKKSKSPAACDGVDNKTLQRIAGELIGDRAGKATEEATESAAPDVTTAQLSDECRAWIEDALLDTSGNIDAAAGYGACGAMSQEELDQAVEDVTDDLIERGATTAP